MRKIFNFIVFVALFSCYSLLSQDIIDPPKLNQLVNSNIIQREQNKFIRGWFCGFSGNMLDSAMFISGLDAGDWRLGIRNREVGI